MTDHALEDSGERMIPELHKGKLIYAEHMTRYMSASDLAKGKVVLDIACGTGYGSQLLAGSAKKVYGVDVDEATVAYAQKKYPAKNIEYIVGDGERIPLDDNSVDLVVTFETIEHIKDYKQFVREVARVLKPDGLAIVSTPNDLEFIEGNHFHLHEFKYKELIGLLKTSFKNIDSYFQATWKGVSIGKESFFTKETDASMPLYNFAPIKPEQYLYFYLLCSNREITEKVEEFAALGEHYSERRMVQDYMATKAELDRRAEETEQLRAVLQDKEKARADTERLLHAAEDELDHIKNSKVYKALRKASRIVRRAEHKDSQPKQ